MHNTTPVTYYVNACVLLCLTLIAVSFTSYSQNSTRLLNRESWQFHKTTERKWYPATIPGTVHTDLFNNKLIPDPFFADNEKQLQWIENEGWEYKSEFPLSEKELKSSQIEIEFDGLDTYATVYLNDSLIITANNMFRKWNKEVKKQLKVGKNYLRVVFESAVKKGKEEAAKLPYTLPGDEKVFARKAQYQYGWDWSPRFVTCGIWKNVKLNFWNDIHITDVKCLQKTLTDSLAELSFSIEMNVAIPGVYTPVISRADADQGKEKLYFTEKEYILEKGIQTITVNYSIKHPKRWWSNGLGEAYLYNFNIAVKHKAILLDEKKINIGLRTIELVREKDKAGSSFYFKLNGLPVFMKGANYIPPDNFLPRVSKENYKTLIERAKDAHMNMLRVWGGGVYADDAFYKECDQNGILVWQDFMFACAMYPGNKDFLDNVTQEVQDNAGRLKNHPCIALWCGNNEIDEGWQNWGWQKQYGYSEKDSSEIWKNYTKLFHEVIPEALKKSAGDVIYWPSSPSIGWGRKESLLQGDSHYWGVWWGMEPFEMYEHKIGRFMSEYGFQSIPDLSTIKKVANETDLSLTSDALKNHQKHPTGYQTINTYMARDYKIPEKFEDFIYVSQLTQALGMKTAIEAHRRAKPYCMGTLYWQLNDCWPVTSWSSVDYYNKRKALHYEVKRTFSDVIISVEKKNDSLHIYIISDKLQDIAGKLTVRLMNLEGKLILEEHAQIDVKANTSSVKLLYDIKKIPNEIPLNKLLLNIELNNETTIASTNYVFVKPKDLLLSMPTFTTNINLKEGFIEISSNVFAKNVWLNNDELNFSDNYFDLLPGEKKTLKIDSKNKSTLLKPIIIKSLYDVN